MFQIVFLRWTCDLLYSRGAPASRDGVNNTSDRALTRQLTWLPSVATRNKVDVSGSLSPEASPARFWDVQPRGGTDTEGQPGGSWNSTCRTGATFLLPHPPPPDKPHLDSYGWKKTLPVIWYLGNLQETITLFWGSLCLSLCWERWRACAHTKTHIHTLTHSSTPWWFRLQWLRIDPKDFYWKFRMDLWEDAAWRG